jgi:hypothetical protein
MQWLNPRAKFVAVHLTEIKPTLKISDEVQRYTYFPWFLHSFYRRRLQPITTGIPALGKVFPYFNKTRWKKSKTWQS